MHVYGSWFDNMGDYIRVEDFHLLRVYTLLLKGVPSG